jgi:hypothetical protein
MMSDLLCAVVYLVGFVLAFIAFRAEALRGEDKLDCLDWFVVFMCAALWPVCAGIIFIVIFGDLITGALPRV